MKSTIPKEGKARTPMEELTLTERLYALDVSVTEFK